MKNILFLLSLFCMLSVNGQIITTIAGNGLSGFSGDGGPASAAVLLQPYKAAFDLKGNLYFSDSYNNRIRKIDINGIISTVVGLGTAGFSGDGGNALYAELNIPMGIAFDTLGNLYIADRNNCRIRKVDTLGIISSIAGNGTMGYSGDGGAATLAQLRYPWDVACDKKGNLYIADELNHCIRKVSLSSIITTVAGNGTDGYSGDGGLATLAELRNPLGVTIDKYGNIFISDYSNNRIRKVDLSGIIVTVAGNGSESPGDIFAKGDGELADSSVLASPTSVAFDNNGNMFICESCDIRQVNSAGIISTFAGTGYCDWSGDGGLATLAELNYPTGVVCDQLGNVFIVEGSGNRIRTVTLINSTNLSHDIIQIHFYPNPTNGQFTIETSTSDKKDLDIYDLNGRHIFSKIITDKTTIDATSLINGIYTLTIKTVDFVISKKLVIVH